MNHGTERKNTHSLIGAMAFFVVLYLFLAPFNRGMYIGYEVTFERPLFIVLLAIFTSLIFIGVYLYRGWELTSHGDILVLLVWLIPISYFVSMIAAVTDYWAFVEFFVRLGWAVFFVLGYFIARHAVGVKALLFALIGPGYLISIYGLLNWFGDVHYKDAVLAERLSSVFQYPNAYAAYLIAITICGLIMIQSSRKKRYIVLHAFMIVLVLLSLLLTLSRGALLVLFGVLIAYLSLLPWKRQLISMMELGITGVAALYVYGLSVKTRGQLLENYSAGLSLRGWLFVLAIATIASFIVLGMELKFGKFGKEKNSADRLWNPKRLALPIALVSVGLALYALVMFEFKFSKILPAEIAARLEGVNLQSTSVFLRNTLYEDGLRAGANDPVFGAGGGAWSVMSESLKSYPYSSAKIHNFYIETYLESGVFGVIILVFLLCYVFILLLGDMRKKIRENDQDYRGLIFPFFSLVILGHSFVDFDMNYFYLSSIVFLSLGVTASISNTSLAAIWKNGRVTKAFASGFVMLAIFMIYQCVVTLRADDYYRASMRVLAASGNYDDYQSAIEKALSLRPKHSEYLLTKAQVDQAMYRQTKNEIFSRSAESSLDKLQSIDPINIQAIEIRYNLDVDMQKFDQALEDAIKAVKLFPWTIGFYEKAIELNLRFGADASLAIDKRSEYLREARLLIDEIKRRNAIIDRLPETEREMSRGIFGLNDYIQAQVLVLDSLGEQQRVEAKRSSTESE